MSELKAIVLKSWKWRQAHASESWTACKHAKPTTEIFTDLLDVGKIPDPFLDRNERDVQWVGETDWEYATEFTYNPIEGHEFVDLVFEGLDTVATVYLNEGRILYSDNMFHSHRVSITGKVKEGVNSVRILFESAFNHAKKVEQEQGKVLQGFNGDPSRLYIRKAQYHYGWDWGPVIMSCGPYKEIRVESYEANVSDVYVNAEVPESLETAKVNVSFDVTTNEDVFAKVVLVSPKGVETAQQVSLTKSTKSTKTGKIQLSLDKPELWYPIKYGPQNRYKVKLELITNNKVLHTVEKLIGFRRLELVQDKLKDQPGTSFFFRINNIPIFAAGSNWIPAHNYLTALTKQDYQGWINKAVVGNQLMLRVWGGGIYEPDIFYEECDRVGILVWQDFMFACGAYPYFAEFAKSVRKEAEDQVKRLRNFCSVAIFAGNNEDYMVAEAKNLEYDRNDLSGDYTKTTFPARTAYETDFPRIVSKYSDVPYHPGSPWGGVNIGDPTIGDIHQWNVWHGQQEKYQNWRKLGGRFVSEFGMLAFPPLKTIKKAITDPQQRYPQSITMDSHNKATGFERRLALYVMENIRVRGMDLESWIYATQLMQSECLAYAYRCWRREWKGPGREYIAGALVWQINDCWPVTSWAICDFYGNNKLAYYAIKRESAQFGVGIYRWTVDEKNGHDEWDLEGPHDLKDKNYIFDVWGVNMTLEPVKVTVQIRYFHVKSGKAGQSFETKEIELLPNRSTEILQDLSVDQETAVQARLLDANGQVIARQGDWPQPLKYLSFPDRKVSVQVSDGKVVISTNAPVKGVEVYLEDEEREVDWQDNGVDVFPGDDFVIEAPGIKADDEVLFRHYEQE